MSRKCIRLPLIQGDIEGENLFGNTSDLSGRVHDAPARRSAPPGRLGVTLSTRRPLRVNFVERRTSGHRQHSTYESEEDIQFDINEHWRALADRWDNETPKLCTSFSKGVSLESIIHGLSNCFSLYTLGSDDVQGTRPKHKFMDSPAPSVKAMIQL